MAQRPRAHQQSSEDAIAARVDAALGRQQVTETSNEPDDDPHLQLPELPTPITTESALHWIEEVIPLVDPSSRMYKQLRSIVQRQHFRMRNNLPVSTDASKPSDATSGSTT